MPFNYIVGIIASWATASQKPSWSSSCFAGIDRYGPRKQPLYIYHEWGLLAAGGFKLLDATAELCECRILHRNTSMQSEAWRLTQSMGKTSSSVAMNGRSVTFLFVRYSKDHVCWLGENLKCKAWWWLGVFRSYLEWQLDIGKVRSEG